MELPRRLSYAETSQALLADGFLEEIPLLPARMPRHDDDEPFGFSVFKGGLEENDLSNLSLPWTFFSRSYLKCCNFSNTNWSESRMCWNDFTDTDFSHADLSACDLRASLFTRVLFCAADLSGADLRCASFENCDFSGASLDGTKLTFTQAAMLSLTDAQRQQVRWYKSAGREPAGG